MRMNYLWEVFKLMRANDTVKVEMIYRRRKKSRRIRKDGGGTSSSSSSSTVVILIVKLFIFNQK
jgi:hypothetical protein